MAKYYLILTALVLFLLDFQRCAPQTYYIFANMSVDYIGPPLVLSASAILPSLCILAVGLRFYTRRKQREDLRLDDWLTVPALVTHAVSPTFIPHHLPCLDRSSHSEWGLLSSLVSNFDWRG